MKDFRDRSQTRDKKSVNFINEEKFRKSKNKVKKLHKLLLILYQLKVEKGDIYKFIYRKKKNASSLQRLDKRIKIVVEKIRKE